ncbi:hypothetical protein Peur_032582 [Populus x canadensis]
MSTLPLSMSETLSGSAQHPGHPNLPGEAPATTLNDELCASRRVKPSLNGIHVSFV